MKVGIPNALFVKENIVMYKSFFERLGVGVVVSSPTTKNTIDNGNLYATSEDCIASKIFIGHVFDLVNKYDDYELDYIVIPRVFKYKKNKEACVKAFALYDICNNLFECKFLDLNIDYSKNMTFIRALTNIGISLGFGIKKSFSSAFYAYKEQEKFNKNEYIKQYMNIDFEKKNILIIGHDYLIEDNYINNLIVSNLKDDNIKPIYSHICMKDYDYTNISKHVYFENNIKSLRGIEEYINIIDACVLVTGFSCATDSLVNEMIKTRLNDIPYIEIVVDDNSSDTGLVTRMESFKDILDRSDYVC